MAILRRLRYRNGRLLFAAVAAALVATPVVAQAGERYPPCDPGQRCFKGLTYVIGFRAFAHLVRDRSWDDGDGDLEQTHQKVDASWWRRASRARGRLAITLRSGARPIPGYLQDFQDYPDGGSRRLLERSLEQRYARGGGTRTTGYTCTGQAGLHANPPIPLLIRGPRAADGGYAIRVFAPHPEEQPPFRALNCSPLINGHEPPPHNLGNDFDAPLDEADFLSLHIGRGQVGHRRFTVSASGTISPPTTCSDGATCSQTLQWRATLVFRLYERCTVPFMRNPANCIRVR